MIDQGRNGGVPINGNLPTHIYIYIYDRTKFSSLDHPIYGDLPAHHYMIEQGGGIPIYIYIWVYLPTYHNMIEQVLLTRSCDISL